MNDYGLRGEVWRNALVAGTTNIKPTRVIASLPCAIFPISRFDSVEAFARESTHFIRVPFWFALRKEDELRQGRRPTDALGNMAPYVYVINGRSRHHSMMPSTTTYYAREKD